MHMRSFMTGLALLLLSGIGTTASAQERGKTGISMGFPGQIGIIWHASDKLAIRPDITFNGGSTSTDSSSFDTTGDHWSVGTGVSVLLYLRTIDKLRTYISPAFNYSHSSSTSNAPFATPTGAISTASAKTTGNAVGGEGSFGAQYSLADKFSVFGEVGFSVVHSTSKSSLSSIKLSGTAWGTRTAVGVIFYP